MARILVVDDEALIAMMLGDLLSRYGHETIGPAHSESQALELIASSDIDAAILDVTLGDHDCFTVARSLQRLGIPLPSRPVTAPMRCRMIFETMSRSLKPFDFDVVKRLVSDLIGQANDA